MCGIAGLIRFDHPIGAEEIQSMTSALRHRGPDGEGLWVEKNIALGHRRLSIIDLETGKQPMCNEDGTIWITFNGEIYNFLELRTELLEKGHRFKTKSDTEVIVHAYEQWGDDSVSRLRGMFAFAIVDRKNGRIFLARDHLGIKPLFYYVDDDTFAFASEIQALKMIKGARFDLDLQGIDQYLCLQYIPAPRTVYDQVKKLPPAHRMSIGLDGKITDPEPYWNIDFNPDHRKNQHEWLEELDAVILESVKSHLISDVPFGAFLSGGIDSSTIVAYMSQILEKPVKTFSIGFQEEAYNELHYAEIAAKRFGTEHYSEIVKPDVLGILPRLVQNYGEPFGDSSAIPTYYLSQLARRHVTMVLSGDGGDELFAGYNSYSAWLDHIEGRPSLIKRILYPIAHKIRPARYPGIQRNEASLENWKLFIQYLSNTDRRRLWRREYQSLAGGPIPPFEADFKRAEKLTYANRVQYMDIKNYLPYDILTKVDIASMANSLEVRTPFVDKKVVEFAATIPEKFNIRMFSKGEWKGKLLLKKLAGKYFSKGFIHRKKMGFGIPVKEWISLNGEWRGEVNERLLSKSSILGDYFESSAIQELLEKNLAGPVWLLLFLEEWLRQNKSL
ncbi:MAG TPA: asparagine synthase (glutamine-hydrolyzing) [Nitrospiria bacterium]|nr:asparagine synthase (glutamine-hydrolyzing) [Nitrospiria bacterium]